jgi:hypothetical protein
MSAATTKHMFESSIKLLARPAGFEIEPERETGTMEAADVAMILEFSDCSCLSSKVLTSHGLGWMPTAYLESA